MQNELTDIRSLVTGIISSVAESQYEMDRNSIKTTQMLIESGLAEQGMHARWYAIPEAELNIKMMLEINSDRELKTRMVDADYSSRYSVDTTLTSDFSMKIKRIPVQDDIHLTVHNEDEIVQKASRVKKVAELLHKYTGCFLNASFDAVGNGNTYQGGNWIVEIIHPPQADQKKKTASGLMIKALFIIDDQSGEFIVAKYYE